MRLRNFYYVFSLLFVFIIPTVVESIFILDRINKTQLIIFIIGLTILGSIWDVWATRHGKKDQVWLWQFNTYDTLGIKILGLPIEEYFFYTISGIYVVFTWEIIKYSLESNNIMSFIILPFCAIWSTLFVAIPYLMSKNDGDKIL